ncbi:hypothetical protein M9458_014396, partial [Cirrhinus mrigala]
AHAAKLSSLHVMMILSCNIVSSHYLQQTHYNLFILQICLPMVLIINSGEKRSLRMIQRSQNSLWSTQEDIPHSPRSHPTILSERAQTPDAEHPYASPIAPVPDAQTALLRQLIEE